MRALAVVIMVGMGVSLRRVVVRAVVRAVMRVIMRVVLGGSSFLTNYLSVLL